MKHVIMTQEIIDAFHERRMRLVRSWAKHGQINYKLFGLHKYFRRTLDAKTVDGKVREFTTIICKGCREKVKAGEEVLELPIGGGAMYVHDRDGVYLNSRLITNAWLTL